MTRPHPPEETRRWLERYDRQLREEAEVLFAESVDRCGPLWRAKFGNRGLVTYRSLAGLSGGALDALVAETIEFYAANPAITATEWKTRGHDLPADLPQRLAAQGFAPEDTETVMMGEAQALAQIPRLPEGVRLRRIDNLPQPYPEVVRAVAVQEQVFGRIFRVEELMRRLEREPATLELWVAETPQEVVGVGRLETVPHSQFAGLWGGGVLPAWRGRGLYRALTAARAQSALKRGLRFLYSDCTEASRPILERGGLVAVTTTTPYVWRRAEPQVS